MTAATLAHLPLQVGGVALASAGRAALWVIARYMRAPLTNTAIAALVASTAMAGSNALWGQQHEHPAPLFAPVAAVARSEPQPVIPRTRPKVFAVGAPATAQPVKLATLPAVEEPTGPIGNKDVFEVQRKLESMKLFSGTIDGYYGPQTARAIKQFQELKGLRPTGTLDREVIEMILAAPLDMAGPKEAPVASPAPAAEARQPAAVSLPAVKAAPVEAELPAARPAASADAVDPKTLAALPQPKPLAAEIQTGSIERPKSAAGSVKLLGRPVPDTPEAALEMAADTAGDAIDTIIGGVQSLAMTRPASAPAQFAADSKPLSTAEAAAPVPLKPLPAATEPGSETLVAALPDNPQVGVPLKIEEEPTKPGEAIAVLDTEATPAEIMAPFSVTDPVIVAKVQRGLASLGFLHGPADGVAGEATAKAIRNFEVYFNYKVTGRISPELLDLLIDNGAAI